VIVEQYQHLSTEQQQYETLLGFYAEDALMWMIPFANSLIGLTDLIHLESSNESSPSKLRNVNGLLLAAMTFASASTSKGVLQNNGWCQFWHTRFQSIF
jgi:hypothetical protein